MRAARIVCRDGHPTANVTHEDWTDGARQHRNFKCPDCRFTFPVNDLDRLDRAIDILSEVAPHAINLRLLARAYELSGGKP